mmetsp:Transcript_7204/g.15595  ORF Transcript_7204/g.15595 Transcript_7204/m.15595 type:complete len:93 (-) Transcript_7204:118-396(-)
MACRGNREGNGTMGATPGPTLGDIDHPKTTPPGTCKLQAPAGPSHLNVVKHATLHTLKALAIEMCAILHFHRAQHQRRQQVELACYPQEQAL